EPRDRSGVAGTQLDHAVHLEQEGAADPDDRAAQMDEQQELVPGHRCLLVVGREDDFLTSVGASQAWRPNRPGPPVEWGPWTPRSAQRPSTRWPPRSPAACAARWPTGG